MFLGTDLTFKRNAKNSNRVEVETLRKNNFRSLMLTCFIHSRSSFVVCFWLLISGEGEEFLCYFIIVTWHPLTTNSPEHDATITMLDSVLRFESLIFSPPNITLVKVVK